MLRTILRRAVDNQASDVHLTPGCPPVFRVDGGLVYEEGSALTAEDLAVFWQEIAQASQQEEYQQQGQCDFSCTLGGVGRFRIHAFRQQGQLALALRIIQDRILTLAEMAYPDIVARMSRLRRGLVLVTGPSGSGKSTTLAAMVEQINRERNCHIITLEDPVEFLHRHRRAVIHQREIPGDAASFAAGLRGALRQDPDVIMVGEMRDRDTTAIALTAAETGHLVLSTLHTASAGGAVERMVDQFPADQQQQIRVQLAGVLQGVIAQQLIPRNGGGQVAALEILIATPAVRNLIREGNTHQLLSMIQTGSKFGMTTMDDALEALCRQQSIRREDVVSYS
ncbi:MAG TPA: PilT/PilU family type 4a pilus ATPase, partial [Patescibacteria group bacterium]|nr:PilT/PilU family type 4a pilus ATPase [Patescibacteria group bacterium]